MKQQLKRNRDDSEYENPHHIARIRKRSVSEAPKNRREAKEWLQGDLEDDDESVAMDYARYIK